MTMDQNFLSTPAQATEDALLGKLRIDQSYVGETMGVKKLLITVPVRKPNRAEFFRVHAAHFLECYMVELKTEREYYFVVPEVATSLPEFAEPVRLRLCVTRQGTAFLWPTKLPRDERRADAWRQSAAEAATMAESQWLRLSADMSLGAYQPYVARGEFGEPKWPEETWPQILAIALRGKLVESADHAVVRELLGL
jgi:hypothetical protein